MQEESSGASKQEGGRIWDYLEGLDLRSKTFQEALNKKRQENILGHLLFCLNLCVSWVSENKTPGFLWNLCKVWISVCFIYHVSLYHVNCKITMIFTICHGCASAAEDSEGVSPGHVGLQQMGGTMVTRPLVCAQEVKERCYD